MHLGHDQHQQRKRSEQSDRDLRAYIETLRRRRLFRDIFAPIVGFFAGVILTIVIPNFAKTQQTKDFVLYSMLAVVSIALEIFAVAIPVLFARSDQRREESHKEMVELIEMLQNGQKIALSALTSLSDKLGLNVEFVVENNGETYDKTRTYIEQARDSISILDYWVQDDEYFKADTADTADSPRKKLYQAILKQIERHIERHKDGQQNPTKPTHPFHRRIIQLSDMQISRQVAIKAGTVFRAYALQCIHYEHVDKAWRSTSFRVAALYIPASFMIIDRRWVILTIFATPSPTEVQRLGAIFIDDPTPEKKFVDNMLQIFEFVGHKAHPLYEDNFPEPENGSASA